MPDAFVPLSAKPAVAEEPDRFVLKFEKVAPFPRKRFLQWASKIKVRSKDYGLTPFKMLGSQLYILDEICAGLEEGITVFIIIKGRQMGSSTLFLLIDLFWGFEHSGLLGVIMVHEEKARDNFRTAIDVFFFKTPKGYLVPFSHHNKNMLILKNDSEYRYLVAGTAEKGRAGGLGRSGAANFVHASEVAFYGTGDDVNEFRSQVSSLYPHRLQIYETTANGFNWFFDFWDDAKKDPTKRCIFVGWWRDERNQLPLDHPFFPKYMPDGIKSKLSPFERKCIREVREVYGFEVSIQQVAWYRWHLESEKRGDLTLMLQEYPWTEDDAFQATGSKFFTAEALVSCTREAKKHPFKAYRYKLGMRFEETALQQTMDTRAPLRVWEEASKFGYYVMGSDPAYGSSDEADRTVHSVWRGYADCMVQVAEFCSPEPSTYQAAWVLAHLAGYYGQCWIMPILEITGPGQAVFDELEKVRKLAAEIKPTQEDPTPAIRNILANMKHYMYRRIDTLGSSLVYQWRSSNELKTRMMNSFKNGVELNRVRPRSIPLLEEMRRIVNDEGQIGGEGRAKDDRVIGAALAYQAWSSWCQPKLKAMNLTLKRASEIDEVGGPGPLDRLIVNFLKKQSIKVPT
jgi:hypothetical protein